MIASYCQLLHSYSPFHTLSSLHFRFRIQAYNTLNPANIGLSTVEVTVERNVNAPVFVRSYSERISENILLGTPIVAVEASDDDGVGNQPIRLSLSVGYGDSCLSTTHLPSG